MLSVKPRSCRGFGTFGARVWRFRGRRFNGGRFQGTGLPDGRCRGKSIEGTPDRSSLVGRRGAYCRGLRLVLRGRGLRRGPRRRSSAGPRRPIRPGARVHAGRPWIESNFEGSRRRRRLRGWDRNRRGWSRAERIWARRIGFRQRRRAWLIRGGCTGRTPGRWPKAREIRFGRRRAAAGTWPGRNFRFKPGNRHFQGLRFALDRLLRHRRIEIAQLAEKRPARPLVNGVACFGRRIRQARDGLGEQRVIVSHVVLRAFDRPSVNPAAELCPSIARAINRGRDRERGSYRHARGWSREA